MIEFSNGRIGFGTDISSCHCPSTCFHRTSPASMYVSLASRGCYCLFQRILDQGKYVSGLDYVTYASLKSVFFSKKRDPA